ncbi:MAG: neutral/alkaline non-lysosomal ceramidase N-terminal domain-containing protein, partial [Pirellulales bacterium]
MPGNLVLWSYSLVVAVALLFASACSGQTWQAGLAKLDITPDEPLRLSGYAARQEPSDGVADRLALRVLVLRNSASRDHDQTAEPAKPLVLVSMDAIAVPASFTVELAKWLQDNYQIPRAHLVVCCTHSHTTPHLPGSIDNILRVEQSLDQQTASQRYLMKLSEIARQAIRQAFEKLQPAKIDFCDANGDFAVNRRVVKEGRWINFGVQADGQVDHRVRVLRITSEHDKLLGAAFQYACHCTTLGPEFNKISADWAGLCAAELQSQMPDAIFLPVIGCGADANPNPRGKYEFAKQHGQSLAKVIIDALKSNQFTALPPATVAQFGTAGLEPELPTNQRLDDYSKRDNPNQSRWANSMLEIRKAMGRLPESVPMPMHVWAFGDALTWVFLSGEPVVEYQFAIEKELSSKATWVAGYTDDLFAYVASQAQRTEGGYEVDESMIYFLQPGRWKNGTQDEVVARAASISKQSRGEDQPLSPAEALKSMYVPTDFRVEQLASEPMVQDPVNIAFGIDGSVWVVEMADYPLGIEGGGRVKLLRDTNGDGKLDRSTTFLSGLGYPTGVQPWRKGVLVIAAPDILYAEDTDGDGVADLRKPLLSGIHEANPQHRASGFEIGLDGRLHFGTGDGTRELLSHVNGQRYEVKQRDVAWNPDTGEVEVMVLAQTQFMPARDSF